MHLTDLNDDCLGRIFQLLNAFDGEQVRRACSRFAEIVNYYCKDIYKSWKKNPTADTEYGNSLTWMAEVFGHLVETIDLRGITAEEFHMLNEFQFPKVKTLRISTIDHAYTPTMLANCFPQLSNLFISGPGLHSPNELCKLVTLEELELHFVPVHMIFQNEFDYCFDHRDELKHRSFCMTPYINESIRANRIEIFALNLVELPRLQRITGLQLSIDVKSSPVKYFFKALGPKVATVRAELIVYMQAVPRFQHLSTLRELTLECNDLISKTIMPKYSKAELYLTQLIEACSMLEVLALPHQWIDEEFQADLLEDLKNAGDRRQKPLELRALVKSLKTFDRKSFITKDVPGLLVITIAEYPKSTFKLDEPFMENFVITLHENPNC